MGIFASFLNKFRTTGDSKTYAAMLDGSLPIFSQFGKDIYASDVVQQCISCIVFEMKKIQPLHIRKNGMDSVPVNDDLQQLLEKPNETMTQSDFLEKVFWQLFLHYNAFIIPTYVITNDTQGKAKKKFTGLYPISPSQVEFLTDRNDEDLYVRFSFPNGYQTTLLYDDVIHIKYRFSVNEFAGGNEQGQPDHTALLGTLRLNDVLLQGVSKALKSSFAVNGIIKYNTLLDRAAMEDNIRLFEEQIKNNESGLMGIDLKGEFIPLQRNIKLVDDGTLKFIDSKILRNFGVSLPILTGDYTKEQYEAFYQKTLEPLIINISQAFTRTLFTDRERAHGNRIKFYPRELIFMDVDQKLEMVRMLGDSGAMFENEKREAFGLMPRPELAGVRMMSKNYGTVDSVQSQIDKENGLHPDQIPAEASQPGTDPAQEDISDEG